MTIGQTIMLESVCKKIDDDRAYAANSNRLLRIAASNGRPVNVSYDASGDMTFDGVNDYAYDAKGRMRAAAAANDNDRRDEDRRDDDHRDSRRATTTYAVNGLGQRIEKRGNIPHIGTGTINYVYDDAGHVLGEYDDRGHAIEETVWLGDIPVAVMSSQGEDRDAQDRNRDERRDRDDGRDEHRLRNNDLFYIASDQLGAPHLITNDIGDVVWSWNHAPFGNTPAFTTTHRGEFISTDLRFPGQVFDEETGLFQNGFRDYNPALGLYNEFDPLGLAAGVNGYQYVGGNPISYTDSMGLDAAPFLPGTPGNPIVPILPGTPGNPIVPNSIPGNIPAIPSQYPQGPDVQRPNLYYVCEATSGTPCKAFFLLPEIVGYPLFGLCEWGTSAACNAAYPPISNPNPAPVPASAPTPADKNKNCDQQGGN